MNNPANDNLSADTVENVPVDTADQVVMAALTAGLAIQDLRLKGSLEIPEHIQREILELEAMELSFHLGKLESSERVEGDDIQFSN